MTSKVKSQTAKAIKHDVELGSDNVFADLNLPDPEERQLRVQLAVRLNDLLAAEGFGPNGLGRGAHHHPNCV